MKTVVKHLEERRAEIQQHLKSGRKEFLAELQEYDKALAWLKKIDELQLSIVQRYDVIKLPDPNTGYAEYRIMNDCETDDINQWVELEIEGKRVTATMDDVLIISRV